MAPRGDIGSIGVGSSSINRLTGILLSLAALVLSAEIAVASQDVLPQLCDNIRCPPMDDIVCPIDSDVRESIQPTVALMHTITAAPHQDFVGYNTSEIVEELYTQCCVAKKCVCKTCYIPDCINEHEVVYELTAESMDTPGSCCGTYECHGEPNCTEVRETESYWLTNCQRCKCFSGERICHQSCDEGFKKPTGICKSKKLNRFYEHGESWKDGCSECECINGEEKCVMSLCRSLNCAPHRQVRLQDACCSICWPANFPMPNEEELQLTDVNPIGYDEDLDADEDEDENEEESMEPLPHSADDYATENEVDVLPIILPNEAANTTLKPTTLPPITTVSMSIVNSTTSKPAALQATPSTTAAPTTTTSSTASSSTAASFASTVLITAGTPPCMLDARHDAPATYQVYPEVVEVVRQTHQNNLLYAIIFFLIIMVIGLFLWNVRMRVKQRSYRPVSNFDDNFNKISSNIKKMNDYV